MAIDQSTIETVTFDSFGTLVDTRSARQVLNDVVPDPESVATQWHPVAAQYATMANYLDIYETYFELHVDALIALAREQDVNLPSDRARELTAVYHELDPYDDVADAVHRLEEAGYRIAIVSNGNPEMLESLVAACGIGDAVEELVSAHEIRTFKPAKALYDHATDRLDASPETIAHVSAGWGDVMGAMHAGMNGVEIDRGHHPWPPFGPRADTTVTSLSELCETLGA